MGRINEQNESDEANLRRSTRKRKPTQHSDFDYTMKENDLKTPKTSRRSSKSSVQSTSSPVSTVSNFTVKDIEPVSEPEPESIQKSSDGEDDSLPILDAFTPPRGMRLQISKMNSNEIIDSHCRSLEARLKKVALKYLRSWTPPPPMFVAPHSLVVGNPSRYSVTEPDDVAVLRVVRDMLDAVAIDQK